MNGKTISYMPTAEAIRQRGVDIEEIALFESLGICFGRKPVQYAHEFVETKGMVERHL